ncbi:zinc knuckle CX2CX4HX4C containing protein [Tanacetum coccineum]|uniref:Zinc knuckle CX2CX4HX4C containing protein n=1 Tax=Tanacetum coccineum TaxID=301880 RepID=A0ABQ4ZKU9_9ASTR
MVRPEIRGNVNFEIKSQFMRKLGEDTFSGNKNDNTHEHIERILDIVSLFNILGVTHDAVMLRVFPITFTGSAKRWVDRLTPRTINTWDLLKKAFIQSNNSEGMAAIASKLDNLGRDMKKLKENVHAIQVGCQLCRGPHPDKECPLNEEVKIMKEVKYREFGRPFPNNNRVNEKFSEGVYGYGSQPPLGDKKPNLTETIDKYMEEMAKRHAKQDEWLKKLYLNTKSSRGNRDKIIQSLETKADIGASINIMPFSMYKRLGMRKLEPINMVIKMADNTKSIPKGILKNLLIKIDKFIFPIDFVILDMIEDFRMPIILGRPLLATTHAKGSNKEADTNKENFKEYEIVEQCLNPAKKRTHWCEALSQEKEGLCKYWASCDPHNDICDGRGLPNDVERLY